MPTPTRRAGRTLITIALAGLAACGGGTGTTRVVIPAGVPFSAAADSLQRAGVIGSARWFRIYASLGGRDRRLRPGTYVISRGMSWGEVLDALTLGKGLIHTVTIPEGYALADMVPLLARTLGLREDSLYAAARDTAWRRRLDVPTPMLEGYLFPDTYSFGDGMTARGALDAMLRRFEQVWEPGWNDRLRELALTRHEALTLASIVEKEARVASERPVIAAVYLNRLRIGMRLQADPTVQYALGGHRARLFYKDLDVRSPYNTYLNAGLPPGPIASPGRASIVAALNPASVPYRYFVAYPDGRHVFTTTYREHQRAVAQARRERNRAAGR